MTETTTAAPASKEAEKAPEPNAEDMAKEFAALPSEFREAVETVNAEITKHNANVRRVKAAEAQNTNQLKHEIYTQTDNPKVKRLYEKEQELQAQIEKLRDQGYKLIESEGLMPKELTEDELNSLRKSVTDSVKDLRSKAEAVVTFEEIMPAYKGKIGKHLIAIETRRGSGKPSGTTGATGQRRIRFKRITVNGDIKDEKGNTVYSTGKNQTSGEMEDKYTLGFLTKFLNKQSSSLNLSQNEVQDAYLKGLDENNLPDEHEFVIPHTYKDGKGNEHTVNFTVKAYR